MTWILNNKKLVLIIIIAILVVFAFGYTGSKKNNALSLVNSQITESLENAQKEIEQSKQEIEALKGQRDSYRKAANEARSKYEELAKSIAQKQQQVIAVERPKSLEEASKKLKEWGYDNQIRD